MTTETPQGDVSSPSQAYLDHLADQVEDCLIDSFQLTLSRKDTGLALVLAGCRLLSELKLPVEELASHLSKDQIDALVEHSKGIEWK